jgi:hypothetical protein
MSLNTSRFAISRNGWIIYLIAVVALFLIANLTSKSSSHPGTVSNIFFTAFVSGLVLAVLLGAVTLIRHRRAKG